MARILIFGDSITYGAWDKEGGWVARLRKWIDEKNLSDSDFYCLVYNQGISGDTSKDILERFEFETNMRINEKDSGLIFIFAIGGNDSAFVHSKKNASIPEKEFGGNLLRLIKEARQFSSKIIFVGLIPQDESKVNPVPWNKSISYKNEYVKKYDEIIKQICKENNVLFIELFDKFSKMNYKKLLEDGCHPNSEGHKIMFEAVRNFLVKNKLIQ